MSSLTHLPDAHVESEGAQALRAFFRMAIPFALIAAVALALLRHGPIVQYANYHAFADQRSLGSLAHAGDVLSNIGFVLIGVFGLSIVRRMDDASPARDGYLLFFAALIMTAIGSSWYHLAPDNGRLVGDRLPIALACAGLIAAVWRDTVGGGRWITLALALFALASVAWWRHTDMAGAGDLRPYLFLQIMPLVLIPLLQWLYQRPRRERLAFGAAIFFYVLAKLCELDDHAIFDALGIVSGHTLKHVWACVAAGELAWYLVERSNEDGVFGD